MKGFPSKKLMTFFFGPRTRCLCDSAPLRAAQIALYILRILFLQSFSHFPLTKLGRSNLSLTVAGGFGACLAYLVAGLIVDSCSSQRIFPSCAYPPVNIHCRLGSPMRKRSELLVPTLVPTHSQDRPD